MANVLRLAAQTRRQINVIRVRVLRRDCLDDILAAIDDGATYATLVDLNDARGRATSRQQVEALNREYDAWLLRLPEGPAAA